MGERVKCSDCLPWRLKCYTCVLNVCIPISSSVDTMPSIEIDLLKKRLRKYGQEHLLMFWSRLSTEQKLHLVNDIHSIDFNEIGRAFLEAADDQKNSKKLDSLLQPIPEELHEGVSRCSQEQLQKYRDEGLRRIANGEVATILLAGGQGTRLGVQYPKGMYDVGLPSHKTLYQLQAERLLRLQELAYEATGSRGDIPWYIMTSEHTLDPTLQFFANNNFFGLKKENLVVFEQYMLPCLTFEGKIILETPWNIAKAPDGNGGLFKALQKRGILDDMTRRNIRYVHVYCVDNILVKMADPVFLGYCLKKNANCAAKVVEKVSPTESVGVVCRVDGSFQVVEYSEISEENAAKRTPDGRLTFNAGNICNHFFTIDFLRQIGCDKKRLRHHVAKKKIPHVGDDGKMINPLKPNGIKLEKFVFDVFTFTESFAAWEVLRQEEFSPLKNADDIGATDTPTSARQALYALHCRYIENAGGVVSRKTKLSKTNGTINEDDELDIIEISPLVSYDGEGLEEKCKGKAFNPPVVISEPSEEKE